MMPGSERGFSLAETLVALVLALLVVLGAFALMNGAGAAAAVVPAAADLQQRARVAADALARDLALAGAGFDGGALLGPLVREFPAVLPRRLGLQSDDAPSTASSQALTVLFIPHSTAQTMASAPIGPGSLQLQVIAQPDCPATALCGFTAGTGILAIDPIQTDRFDLFSLTAVSGSSGTLAHRGPQAPLSFASGAAVAAIEMHTYYFDAADHQLRDYDGYMTDSPLIDHVVDARFEYFGDPRPPSDPRPPPGVQNCLYDAEGTALAMPVLAPQGGSLAPLPLSMFTDGPWCGSGLGVFDADLLRIRKIRVTIRLEAALSSLRGVGASFLDPGESRSALRSVPDYVISFDVAPRNLSPWR